MAIRLKETPFELDGKIYTLRCNMNVLADVQEQCGGTLDPAINGKSALKSSLLFLAAMLNDSAEENRWPERFTAQELGRRRLRANLAETVVELVTDGLTVESEDGEKTDDHAESFGSIDFAWFLEIWLCRMHCEERLFWKTMNPSRCILLYRSYFGDAGAKHGAPAAPQKRQSLAAYMMGGT